MNKQLKTLTSIGVIALAMGASTLVQAETFVEQFWHPTVMTQMDKNKDGMVTRQEYLDYMGAQFDKMDAKKKGMLTKQEFTDKKMMQSTFPKDANITAGG